MDELENVLLYEYSEDDYIMETDARAHESKFDRFLQAEWRKAAENGYFKYQLKNLKSQVCDGEPKFLMQLNPARGKKRRPAAAMTSMQMPYDAQRFNFNKIPSTEILCRLQPEHSSQRKENLLVINVSPLEFGHVLLVPDVKACLPQTLDVTAVRLGVDLMLLSADRGFRVGFNSLLGQASVNHQHLHAWYLQHNLPVETTEVERLAGSLFVTRAYFAPAFCLQLHGSTVQTFSRDIHTVTSYLQENNIAHNVFFTRGVAFPHTSTGELWTVRAYIWPRKHETGTKDTATVAFNVAVAELAGHVPVYDETAFKELRGEQILDKIQNSLFSEKFFRDLSTNLIALFKQDS